MRRSKIPVRALALRAAQKTHVAAPICAAVPRIYARENKTRWLEFDDSYPQGTGVATNSALRMGALPIDGGIDHILGIEAQDPAPRQWDVIRTVPMSSYAATRCPREEELHAVCRR